MASSIERVRQAPLVAILSFFLLLGGYYAVTNPLYSKPDEVYHYAYVLHLKAGSGLPAVDVRELDRTGRSPTELEAHQPPLYYAMVALASSFLRGGIEVTEALSVLNPHFLTTSIGNRNPWAPGYASSPLEAPVFFIGRFVSLLFAAMALVFCYLAVRLFLPRPIAVLSMAFMGFNPQFLCIATSFSNDMAGVAMANLGLWQAGVAVHRGLSLRRAFLLGVIIAAAAMAKLGGIGLLAPVALVGVWHAFHSKSRRPLLWAGVVAGVVAVADSWWFWRNWRLYGDPFAVSVLPVLLGHRSEPMGWDDLRELLEFLWKSYWLDFSPGALLFAETEVYCVLGAACLLALAGLIVHLLRQREGSALMVLTWGWFVLVLVSLVRLTSAAGTFMGGGRLLFPAALAGAVTLAVGLTEIAGRRLLVAAAVAIGIALYAVVAPQRYLDAAYPRPLIVTSLQESPSFDARVRFGDGRIELAGYDLAAADADCARRSVNVTYYWRTIETNDRDFSVFVQLLDDDNRKWSQVDTFPGYGTLPTSVWRPGQFIIDRVSLPLPMLDPLTDGCVITGLYDLELGERLRAVDHEGRDLSGQAVALARVYADTTGEPKLFVPGQGTVDQLPSYPVGAFFDDELELTGYDLDFLETASDSALMAITYYWRALRDGTRDLTSFAQLLSPKDGQPVVSSQVDELIGDGLAPTSRWKSGQVFVQRVKLALPAGPDGRFGIVFAGLYHALTVQRLLAVDSAGQRYPSDAVPLAEVLRGDDGCWQVLVQGEEVVGARGIP